MTYSTSFEKTLKKLPNWVNATVKSRTVVYTGKIEMKEGDISIVNYKNL